MTHRERIDQRAKEDPCPQRLHQTCFGCGEPSYVSFAAGQWYCAECGTRAVDHLERRVAQARATSNAEAKPESQKGTTTDPEPAAPPENVDSSPEADEVTA